MTEIILATVYVAGIPVAAIIAGRTLGVDRHDPFAVGMVGVFWPLVVIACLPYGIILAVGWLGTRGRR